jgi:hypothetical protein
VAWDSASRSADSENAPFSVSAATFDRLRNPAAGRDGGRTERPAPRGSVQGACSKRNRCTSSRLATGSCSIYLGRRAWGTRARRERARIEADIAAGLVSDDGVARDYPARK